MLLSERCWCVKWYEGPNIEILCVHVLKCPTFPLNIPMFASVPRKPVLCPVRYWLEADLCPLQTLSPRKGLPAKVRTRQGRGEGEEEEKAQKAVSHKVALPQVPLVLQIQAQVPLESKALSPQCLSDGTPFQVGVQGARGAGLPWVLGPPSPEPQGQQG